MRGSLWWVGRVHFVPLRSVPRANVERRDTTSSRAAELWKRGQLRNAHCPGRGRRGILARQHALRHPRLLGWRDASGDVRPVQVHLQIIWDSGELERVLLLLYRRPRLLHRHDALRVGEEQNGFSEARPSVWKVAVQLNGADAHVCLENRGRGCSLQRFLPILLAVRWAHCSDVLGGRGAPEGVQKNVEIGYVVG